MSRRVEYSEINGVLDGATTAQSFPLANAVVLSNISHGGHACTQAQGTGIKYVAQGTEYYTINGRTHAVHAGQFLCVSQSLPSVVEIKRRTGPALGMCMFIRAEGPSFPGHDALEEPIVFPARASTFGNMLETNIKRLLSPAADRATIAMTFLSSLEANLEFFLEGTSRSLDSLHCTRRPTRYENLRKLELARGYLHDVVDRPVELAELATVAGLSRFQLLRNFRDCYGHPPATYHRLVRLRLAKQELDAARLSCAEAAHRYGFADGSSFSHAYRRAFGTPPVRSLAA